MTDMKTRKRTPKNLRLKSPQELALMRRAGLICQEALAAVEESIEPGVTTAELDSIAERVIRSRGAEPSFKGYAVGGKVYPAATCISVNDEVVHGIPGDRELCDGDIAGVDLGACFEGYHADTAVTFPVGVISAEAGHILSVASEALYAGIERVRPGGNVTDISRAVQARVEEDGFGIVRELVGHGVGCDLHEAPEVPNVVSPAADCVLEVGMTICIEPMITMGSFCVKLSEDLWTYATVDGGASAHFEHTVAVTAGEPLLLTAGPDGDDSLWRVVV